MSQDEADTPNLAEDFLQLSEQHLLAQLAQKKVSTFGLMGLPIAFGSRALLATGVPIITAAIITIIALIIWLIPFVKYFREYLKLRRPIEARLKEIAAENNVTFREARREFERFMKFVQG
ncbi:hypothetical protein L0B52_05990 [Suttonella sp. R2A3]|uniref:hypothetical protein n=1 Tax=Suttonella sp. R2A3 TaxID=2908648 RepID=UPI001F276417|nr:hypothetical protein [Suttonella sp. R2A3]UJF23895.1 hypothetical protein L0B52_05990 [Suttonella sp. R2A3]